MMNLNKDTIECATFPTAGSEFLKAMDAHRQGDEPFASAEMGELMCRTDEVLKGLSPEDGAKLRGLSAGWRELVLTGMRSPAAMRPILPMASGSCSPPPRRGLPGGRRTCA